MLATANRLAKINIILVRFNLFNFLTQNLNFLVIMIAFALDLPNNSVDIEIAKTKLVKYCSYDIRSRTNFIQQLMNETE